MNATRPIRTLFVAALGALLGASGVVEASAQSVTTVPVGAMVYNFPPTNSSSTTTYISIPLTNPSVYAGPVVSLTANVITFSGTPFTSGQLAQAGSPFFARIASGVQAGRTMLITANTANSITVDITDNSSQTTALNTAGWSLAASDRVEIIVGDTLASLFGDNTPENPLLFTSTGSSLTSDTVSIYNKASAKFDGYYYNTTSGYWRSLTVNQNSNHLVLYPEATIVVLRRPSRGAVTLTITGDVPVKSPLTKVTGSNSIVYVGTRFPVDMSLSELSFTNWVQSNSSLTADSVIIYNPSAGKTETFFKRLDNGQWNRAGGGAADWSSLVVGAGSSIGILKRSSVSGQTSLISQPLPYTL